MMRFTIADLQFWRGVLLKPFNRILDKIISGGVFAQVFDFAPRHCVI